MNFLSQRLQWFFALISDLNAIEVLNAREFQFCSNETFLCKILSGNLMEDLLLLLIAFLAWQHQVAFFLEFFVFEFFDSVCISESVQSVLAVGVSWGNVPDHYSSTIPNKGIP